MKNVVGYLVLFTALIISSTVWAYGRKGHAIVGHIAEVHLTGEARAAVRNILCGRMLSDIANWGDDIHNDPKFAGILPLHYVQIQKGVKTYEDSTKNPNGDLVVGTQALINYLRTGDENELAKVAALKGIGQKAALELMVHFYGDLHQPLHVGYPDDKGANDVKVDYFGKPANLHNVWDEKMLDDGHPEFDAIDYAKELSRQFLHEDPKVWQTHEIIPWVNYSFSLREDLATFPDTQPPPTTPPAPPALPNISYKYNDKNMPLMEHQLWLGGMRLAFALNEIFKTPTPQPEPALQK